MKKVVLFVAIVATLSSCRTLTSTTTIKPYDSFVLGNNEHGSFSVKVKNISSEDITTFKAPIAGGTHTYEIIKPSATTKVSVEKNTALIFENKSGKTANVELYVKGDTGLSMGYKNN